MRKVNPDRDYLDHFAKKPLALRVVTVLDTKAGIGWTTEHLTAAKVPVKTLGVGQESFSKTIDNTDISRNIEIIMGLKK